VNEATPEPRQIPVILASTSKYRAELLGRLAIDFQQVAPECDESPLAGETPGQLVERLSAIKAESIAGKHSQGIVIGSDQVADHNGRILGKPGTPENAAKQLADMSGSVVVFRTGYCLVNAATGQQISGRSDVEARFRNLAEDEIKRYLEHDKPYDCAGAFRSEALGISLLESMHADDPTTIIGLPLIRIAMGLREFGIAVP